MKFIAFICTILLATSTGFATPLAAPAADIFVNSPALEERQINVNNNNLCVALTSAQSLANQGVSSANPTSFIDSIARSIRGLASLSNTPIPGFDDSINKLKAEVKNGSTSASDASAKAFAQAKTTLVSTSFLGYISE
jgi:hypothetical protein